jgi:hypothetical protein
MFRAWPAQVDRLPIPFVQWMTEQAVSYLGDPEGWLRDGPVALPLNPRGEHRRGRPQSILPSEMPLLANYGPPQGAHNLPVETVQEVI